MKKTTAALCAFTVSIISALPLQTIGATVKMVTETFVINKVSEVSNYVDKVVEDTTAGMATETFVTNKVSEATAGMATETFVTNKVSEATAGMATETFVTNKVSEVKDYVDEVVGYSATVKRIAMFIIPVNREPSSEYPESSSFSGFELKASTNNFARTAGSLQFYAQSEAADMGAGDGNEWDKMKMYVCTDYGSSWDVRAYTKIGNTIDWGYKLGNVVVLVDTSCIVMRPGDWLREDNEDLMWCYMRNKNNDVEYEDGSAVTLWHPIAPVRWFSKLPNWAVQ